MIYSIRTEMVELEIGLLTSALSNIVNVDNVRVPDSVNREMDLYRANVSR